MGAKRKGKSRLHQLELLEQEMLTLLDKRLVTSARECSHRAVSGYQSYIYIRKETLFWSNMY